MKNKVGTAFNFLFTIVSIMLVIGIFRIIYNGETISLYKLITFCQNIEQIPTDWITSFVSIKNSILIADWGIFQWLGDGLNFISGFFVDILGLALYVSVGIGNLVVFAGYIVAFLFQS